MKILRLLLLALSILSLPAVASRASVPIIEYENIGVTRTSASADQVKQAIEAAARSRGWEIVDQSPGKLVATVHVRGKHSATVEIPYTASKFSVRYRSSTNLNYVPGGEGLIHPHYNKWVQLLVDGIRGELAH
jgi:hypothetical protein